MLEIPVTYQGGKQRLAKQIVDVIFEQNEITDDTKFYDLCCGSGAVTIELVNRGIHPSNITMVDKSTFGYVWNTIANDEFEMKKLKHEIDKLPDLIHTKDYLFNLSKQEIDKETMEYVYLLLQSGSFGGKAIWNVNNKWCTSSFRNYWLPTETSNRRSPVNPMMPMPQTLYKRMEKLVYELGGIINAINCDVTEIKPVKDSIVYIDPPYDNTSGYGHTFNYMEYIKNIESRNVKVYLSEGKKISDTAILLSKGREKGNINGNKSKKSVEEWLNIF